MSFHLRPVSDLSPSPTSMTPPRHNSPPKPSNVVLPSPPTTNMAGTRPRRPFSPSSLRDVDLNPTSDTPMRKYAAPLTGHDLMAMFPPAPPDNFPEMRAGPTSGYFQRQERAFFAQAGKEIVRVRVEVDLQNNNNNNNNSSNNDPENGLNKPRTRDIRPPYPHPLGLVPHHSPHSSPSSSSSAAPILYAHPPNSRPIPQRGPALVASAPLYPNAPQQQQQPSAPPLNIHPPTLRTPPHEATQPGISHSDYQTEEYDDEAWRRPMPYAERRRAGKHTRRVIVRT